MMLSLKVSSYDATSNRDFNDQKFLETLNSVFPELGRVTKVEALYWTEQAVHRSLIERVLRISTCFKTINRECVTEKVEDTNSISLDQRRHLMSARNASKLFFGFYWIKCVAITVSILQPVNSHFNILTVTIHFNSYTTPGIKYFLSDQTKIQTGPWTPCYKVTFVWKNDLVCCHMRVTLLIWIVMLHLYTVTFVCDSVTLRVIDNHNHVATINKGNKLLIAWL